MTTTWVLNGRTWGYRQSDVPGSPYFLMGPQVFKTWHLLMQDIAAAGQQMETAAGAIESLIDVLPDALAGLVPALEGGAGKYLRLDPEGHVFELAALDAASLTGQVPVARMGTGTAGAGTVLRGDGTWGTALGNIQVGSLQVLGDLVVSGSTVTVDAETVTVADNRLLLNAGEVGSGVTAGVAGIQVDRGSAPDYFFEYDETRGAFVIGQAGDTQAVATREDTPLDGGFARWSAAAQRYDAVSPAAVRAAISAPDYETGTFTAVLSGTGGGAYNQTEGQGHYVRIGRQVTVMVPVLAWDAVVVPYAGYLSIHGLPYPAGIRGAGIIAAPREGLTRSNGGDGSFHLSIDPGATFAYIIHSVASPDPVTGADYSHAIEVGGNGTLYGITGTYFLPP